MKVFRLKVITTTEITDFSNNINLEKELHNIHSISVIMDPNYYEPGLHKYIVEFTAMSEFTAAVWVSQLSYNVIESEVI